MMPVGERWAWVPIDFKRLKHRSTIGYTQVVEVGPSKRGCACVLWGGGGIGGGDDTPGIKFHFKNSNFLPYKDA